MDQAPGVTVSFMVSPHLFIVRQENNKIYKSIHTIKSATYMKIIFIQYISAVSQSGEDCAVLLPTNSCSDKRHCCWSQCGLNGSNT